MKNTPSFSINSFKIIIKFKKYITSFVLSFLNSILCYLADRLSG